jgi:voltage-gated potassium channel
MFFEFNLASRRHEKLMKSTTGNNIKKRLMNTVSALALLCCAHTGAIMFFEKLGLGDAAWLTMTTVATVGYGDLSAHTLGGRIATVGLMYLGGIAAMAQTAALFFEAHQERRDSILNGKWSWKMKDHIVILNNPLHGALRYYKRLAKELRKSDHPRAQTPIIVVGLGLAQEGGLPVELREKGMAHVDHDVAGEHGFQKSSLKDAAIIVVMCTDQNEPSSDSTTFDLIARAREANPAATIIAEVVTEENDRRMLAIGADHVIRPVRAYPAMLARTILAPGAETVIDDIFSAGGTEIVRYDVPLKGLWNEIAGAVINADIGMPLSYIDRAGKVVSNVRPESPIDSQGIFVVAREGNVLTSEKVLKSLAASNPAIIGRKTPEVQKKSRGLAFHI